MTIHLSNARQHGHSLIEIVVVMGILIILTAIALPQLRGARNLSRFAGLQRELMTQLRLVRQQAMSERVPITLRYDDTAKRLILFGGSYGAAGASANRNIRFFGSGVWDYQVIYGRPSGAPTTPLADATNLTPLASGVLDVTFQPDGSVLDGAGNPLAQALFFYNADLPLSTAFAVSILGFGGRVKGWQYNSTTDTYNE